MPETPHFGTDGWRGIIAEDFTFAAVRRVSQALALEVRERFQGGQGAQTPALVIGYDTRFGSGRFAAAAAEVIAAHDIHVHLCRTPVPVPVVSHAVVQLGADGGMVITASHNPAQFNGIKLKGRSGAPASFAFLRDLEARLATLETLGGDPPRRALDAAEDDGNLDRINPVASYLEALRGLVDLEPVRNAGMTVVTDAMYGAAAGILPSLFTEATTKLIEINGQINPAFPNLRGPEPIAANLTRLGRLVQDGNSTLGIAFDADGDRLGVIGQGGRYISAQTIFALLTLYLLEVRGWNGPIVKSLNGTTMVDLLAQDFGVPVYETPVGFGAVAPLLREHDAIIGGEETGGFGFRDHIPERDAILSALFLLDMLAQRGGTLDDAIADLEARVGEWFYERLDIPCRLDQCDAVLERVRAAAPRRLAGVPITRTMDEDGMKYVLEDGSWLLIRFSGTEPVLRLYAEAHSTERVNDLLTRGRELSGL
jgi:phosphomannomutase